MFYAQSAITVKLGRRRRREKKQLRSGREWQKLIITSRITQTSETETILQKYDQVDTALCGA